MNQIGELRVRLFYIISTSFKQIIINFLRLKYWWAELQKLNKNFVSTSNRNYYEFLKKLLEHIQIQSLFKIQTQTKIPLKSIL